jgi:hypothetical protein
VDILGLIGKWSLQFGSFRKEKTMSEGENRVLRSFELIKVEIQIDGEAKTPILILSLRKNSQLHDAMIDLFSLDLTDEQRKSLFRFVRIEHSQKNSGTITISINPKTVPQFMVCTCLEVNEGVYTQLKFDRILLNQDVLDDIDTCLSPQRT